MNFSVTNILLGLFTILLVAWAVLSDPPGPPDLKPMAVTSSSEAVPTLFSTSPEVKFCVMSCTTSSATPLTVTPEASAKILCSEACWPLVTR